MKKLLLTLLAAVMCVTAWATDVTWTASEAGYANAAEVSNVTINSNISLTFDKGTNNNNAPKYYTSGTAVRVYGGNTIAVNATNATITGITFTFGASDGSNAITANVGTFTSPSWSGSANAVTFTIGGTSGNRRISAIAVTYTTSGGGSTPDPTPSVTAPTFDVAAGTYNEEQLVLISNYNSDYIYAYTLDGTDPAFDANLDVTNGTAYDNNEGIEITSSCTLKAIAVDEEGNLSSITSASYVILEPFASLEDLVAADLATNTNVTVSFENVPIKAFQTVSSTRKGVYFDIQKGGKDIEIYYNAEIPAEWEEGGTLSGTLTDCPWTLYSGTWELAPTSGWSWENLSYTAPDPSIDRDAVKRVEFDNLGYASWGKSSQFSSELYDELEQTVGDVKFNYSRNSGYTYANNNAMRFYKSNELKFSAPSGYVITSIVWTGSNFKDDVTTDAETCTSTTSGLSWSGLAESVTFTRPSGATSYITLSAVTVTINKVATATIAASGYTTVTAPFNFTVAGGTPYYAASTGAESVTLTSVDDAETVFAAGTGLMIKGTARETVTLTATSAAATFSQENLLVGVTAAGQTMAAGTNYVLATKNDTGVTAFYLYNGEATPLVGKAYLNVAGSSPLPASALRIDIEGMEDGMETAISLTPSLSEGEGACYDLYGRKSNGKGLMIQNGKVVLVK